MNEPGRTPQQWWATEPTGPARQAGWPASPTVSTPPPAPGLRSKSRRQWIVALVVLLLIAVGIGVAATAGSDECPEAAPPTSTVNDRHRLRIPTEPVIEQTLVFELDDETEDGDLPGE